MSATSTDTWVENRAPTGWHRLDLRELWAYRELIGFLAIRDLKARYKQAALGMAWAVLQPLAGALIFTVVFHRVARLSSGDVPYLLFAFSGISLWSYLSGGMQAAMESLVGNVGLVTKVYFPRMAAPVAAVLPGLLDLAIALVILAVLMAVEGVSPGVEILTLPLWLAALVLLTLGVGLLLATLNVRYRDVKSIAALAIQLWLFASPIAYASTLVQGRWSWLYELNPMAGIVDGFRWAVFGTPQPGWGTVLCGAEVLLILGVGIAAFSRQERRFADVI
ncbi:ABC transporter permease [Baekduia soli]|uniref:ABC transporter permease n=1 Tax=Baekduia soli TaxID=496014 RepID=UPI001651CE83|nr:ABC transporter permease [Baekduia soli]